MMESAAIMFVDDHAIVREGYRSLLQKQPRLKVVAEAGDGAEAYRLFKQTRPDLVIMDLAMPGFGGIEAIRRIRQWDPAARILVFTMHQNAAYAVQAVRAGAKGYVTKSSPPAFSADIDHELALSRVASTPAATDVLTPREFEILRMLLSERSTEDIAEILHLSPKTVANTRYLIKAKLAVTSDIELVLMALRQGILGESRGIEEGANGR